jgi:hypothetical protein
MEAIWITVIIVAGIVVAIVVPIVVPICVGQWARVRRVEAEARLKQDMLARGLSVEEIERLSTSEGLRETQIVYDNKVRDAQIAADAQVKRVQIDADLRRDMLTHGLSVEEIERLTTPKSPASPRASQSQPDVLVLATACASMVQTGEDAKAIAAFLTPFMGWPGGSQWAAKDSRSFVSPEASQARPEALGLGTAVESMVNSGKDTKEIAALLTVFLGRHDGPQETVPESKEALSRWPAPGRIDECAPSSRPEHERNDIQDKRSEAIVPAERRG